MPHKPIVFIFNCLFILTFLSACAAPAAVSAPLPPTLTQTPPPPPVPSPTPIPPTHTPPPAPTIAPTAAPASLWLSPAVPAGLQSRLNLPAGFEIASESSAAQLRLEPADPAETGSASKWVYVLVAPFATAPDGVSLGEFEQAWRGEPIKSYTNARLYLSAATRAALETRFGPAADSVQTVDAAQMLDLAWTKRPSWAVLPFEELGPRWKVLSIDAQSPIQKEFDASKYPLVVPFTLHAAGGDAGAAQTILPPGNRDPQRLTTLILTGTTALVRNTAARMELHGITYPARDIRPWLTGADLTHISNEIAFSQECAPALPVRSSMKFCSSPRYIALLQDIGVDIIELTGNHVMDWGADPLNFTLQLYRQNNMQYYGGGDDLERARQPLLVEHNGNRLAFLGCNSAGPASAYATGDQPGANPCDREWMTTAIQTLRAGGYQVIFTFQHLEDFSYQPAPPQRGDFQRAAEAGAAIVSGSQAHFPQSMTFINDSFVHFGLGNLFFDQMDTPIRGTRREFLDRHVFYDGRHISTELLTAMLEDYARPRPMTPAERDWFLHKIFRESGWERIE